MKMPSILTLIAETPMGIREISRTLKMPKSSVEKVLKDLALDNWTYQRVTDKQFKIGYSFIEVACNIVSNLNIRKISSEVLNDVSNKTGETVFLTIKTGDMMTFIDRVDSKNTIQYKIEIGTKSFLHAGAAGKAVLANMPTDEAQQLIKRNGLQKFTENTIIEEAALFEDLELIKKRGWAISYGEKDPNVSSIAAPIFSSKGVTGSVSVAIPDDRLNDDLVSKTIGLITNGCKLISSVLIAKREDIGNTVK